MAEVSDLTTAQLETLLTVDFNTMYTTLVRLLGKVITSDDREKAELDTLLAQLLLYKELILASGNTAAVTAYDILNP